MEMQNTYTTKDLSEAAALKASGCLLTGHIKTQGIFWFEFADKTLSESLSEKYWNYQLQIDAKTLADASHSLKSIIFSSECSRNRRLE